MLSKVFGQGSLRVTCSTNRNASATSRSSRLASRNESVGTLTAVSHGARSQPTRDDFEAKAPSRNGRFHPGRPVNTGRARLTEWRIIRRRGLPLLVPLRLAAGHERHVTGDGLQRPMVRFVPLRGALVYAVDARRDALVGAVVQPRREGHGDRGHNYRGERQPTLCVHLLQLWQKTAMAVPLRDLWAVPPQRLRSPTR